MVHPGERRHERGPCDGLTYRQPEASLRARAVEYARRWLEAEPNPRSPRYRRLLGDFEAYLADCFREACTDGLPAGAVPAREVWMFAGERMVGVGRVRLRLTDRLRREGGHIGYEIAPDARGMGLATALLGHLLSLAGREGLDRVLLTCRMDNPASRRVIAKCGGRLHRETTSRFDGARIGHYWIETACGGTSAQVGGQETDV